MRRSMIGDEHKIMTKVFPSSQQNHDQSIDQRSALHPKRRPRRVPSRRAEGNTHRLHIALLVCDEVMRVSIWRTKVIDQLTVLSFL